MCSVHKVMDEMCRLEEKIVEPNGAFSIIIPRRANGGSVNLRLVSGFADSRTRACCRSDQDTPHPDLLRQNTQPHARRGPAWLPGPPPNRGDILRSRRP